MNAFSNIEIRASAGSGKTFQLSNRYLRLILEKEPLDTILASTFTRKAAGEILDRILLRLAEAKLDEKKRTELSGFVRPDGPLVSVEEIDEILLNVVRNLHRMRVSTLDSFFIQIAGNFSLELKIPTGWSVVDELDERHYLLEAVRNSFTGRDTADSLRLMHMLSHGELVRSVTDQALEMAIKMLGVFRQTPRDAWEELKIQKTLEENEVPLCIERYLVAPLPEDARAANAREKSVDVFKSGNWNEFLAKGLSGKAFDGSFSYYNKAFPGELVDAIEPLIEHAKASLVNRVVIQTAATGEMLERINEEFESIKLRNRALRFEDITLKLTDSVILERIEWIMHRLDAKTKHLLLDEFQDTSPVQWRVLKPFATEATKKSLGSFFCVGDVKQAIYAWRGGVAEIFDEIEYDVPMLQKQSLDKSYRSSQPVMDTVNLLFENISKNRALAEYKTAGDKWEENFETHLTDRTSFPGYCTLETAPAAWEDIPEYLDDDWDPNDVPDDEENSSEETPEKGEMKQETLTLKFAIHKIKELHEAAPQARIGVLTYRNRTIGQLIYGLRRLGLEASEEGGNPITDSAAVQIVLSACRLADHPGDTVARFHLLHSPLAPVFGLGDYRDDSQAMSISLSIRRKLFEDGYGKTIKEWINVLAPSCDQRELDRLSQLLELAFLYQEKAGIRVDPFVEFVQETKLSTASAAKIRVMTINQAKGLEFDIVVLPDLTRKLVGQNPKLLVGRETPTSPINRVIRYADKTVQSLLPEEFQKMFTEHDNTRVEESLCLLYVAITRAIYRLMMIVPPIKPVKDKKGPATRKTLDGVLRYGLIAENAVEAPETLLFDTGNPRWLDDPIVSKLTELESLEEPEESIRLSPKVAPLDLSNVRNIPRVAPSSIDYDKETDPEMLEDSELPPGGVRFESELYAADRREAMLQGTLIHACFEKGLSGSGWLEQEELNRKKLLKFVTEIAAPERGNVDPEKIVDLFFKLCQKPKVKKMLSRKTYEKDGETPVHVSPDITDPHWKVFSERDFIIFYENRLMKGSIDRLTLLYDGGKLVGADIIDFKTDRSITPERKQHYEAQMNAYREAVMKLYRLPKEKVSRRLLFLLSTERDA